MDIIDLSNGFYTITFSEEDDDRKALEQGPWFIGINYLSVQPWTPNFDPNTKSILSMAVWIRLNALPLEYFDKEIHYALIQSLLLSPKVVLLGCASKSKRRKPSSNKFELENIFRKYITRMFLSYATVAKDWDTCQLNALPPPHQPRSSDLPQLISNNPNHI
ncbi:hypothetical protein RJ640_011861 [Escallonia rubra]|uniref:DUF4283 domain-containing protein n=1 Tax=Escallonia rubra TaxID=112253 RepID=A0AA88RIS5_9ASTE|nr:hypothetical protein RJ640_011861 [Escallonia rubra]